MFVNPFGLVTGWIRLQENIKTACTKQETAQDGNLQHVQLPQALCVKNENLFTIRIKA